jgi:hypothetical protein
MPKQSANAARPWSVTVSARPRGARLTQPAGQVVPLLRPIHAVAREWPLAHWHFDADAGEEAAPGVGQLVAEVVAGTARGVIAVAARVVATVAADERLAIQQAAHDCHPKAARDMVVTRARRAQSRRPGALPQRAHRPRRREAPQLLEQLADLGTGQPVVAVPAMAFDGQ